MSSAVHELEHVVLASRWSEGVLGKCLKHGWIIIGCLMLKNEGTGAQCVTGSSQAMPVHQCLCPVSPSGLPVPAVRHPVPRTITFQRKRANRRVINEEALLQLLSSYGQVGVDVINNLNKGVASGSSLHSAILHRLCSQESV